MTDIKTGIYKKVIIKIPEKELLIEKSDLVKTIKDLQIKMNQREFGRGSKWNVERIGRMIKTGKMLMEGYLVQEIASELNLKYSTVENYLFYLNPKT